MIVSIIFFAVAYLPMGSDDPGTLELSISPYRLNWSSPWSVTGLIAIKTIRCPHGAYRAGGGRCIPVAWAKCCEYLSIQRRMKLLLIRRLMHKSAFVLGVGGEIWSYKPTLYLIPSRCSTNVCGQPERREYCSRRRERRVGRARLIWDAVGPVLGLKLKPGLSEPGRRTTLSGWLQGECQSPWVDLLIWDFNQKAVGSLNVLEHIGAVVQWGQAALTRGLCWDGFG